MDKCEYRVIIERATYKKKAICIIIPNADLDYLFLNTTSG